MSENEQVAGFFNAREMADELLEDVTRLNERRQNNIFNSVHLGVIEECEKDKDGAYNGKATVRLVSTPGVRTRCLLPVPSGQSYWFGGFPPAGSLCQVAWLPLGVAIVTAIYPFNYRTLVNFERFIDLVPGEVMVQACSGVLKEEQKAAGRGLFDRHGRIHLETVGGTARIVLGDPGLANGLTTLESEDSETGEKTVLRIQAGNATINITDQESIVIRNEDGAKIVMEGKDITISGGGVTVEGDTTVSVEAPSVSIKASSLSLQAPTLAMGAGAMTMNISGSLKADVPGGKGLATEDFVLNVFNNHIHGPGSFTNSGGSVLGISAAPLIPATASSLTSDVKVR